MQQDQMPPVRPEPESGPSEVAGTPSLGPEVEKVPTVEPDAGATLLRWLARMRREAPVWYGPNGRVHVFRHEDIMQIMTDPATFSSDLTGATAARVRDGKQDDEEQKPSSGQLLMLDPPEHGKLRRLISRAFTTKMVAELEPQIAEISTGLLDKVRDSDAFEMNDVIANPLPVTVISLMLGVPITDRDKFQGWADHLLSVDPEDPESRAGLAPTAEALRSYLQRFVDARRADPQDDLISKLCTTEVDGERLNDNAVVTFSGLLLLAGHVTTSMLLGNILLCLDEQPELYKELREDRSKVNSYIEETLRLRPPFTKIDRIAVHDVEVAGVKVAAGSHIYLWLLSANRDEEIFDFPDTFLPDRTNSKQVAFGHGIHYCIGAPIARLEARIVLNLLLDRYSEIRVDRSEPLSFFGSNIFGASKLPLTVNRA